MNTEAKISTSAPSSSSFNVELTNFYSDIGLETMARDAGVIEVEVATQPEIPPQSQKTYKIIAVQVPNKNQTPTSYQVGSHASQILLASSQMPPNIQIKSEPNLQPQFQMLQSPESNSWYVNNVVKKKNLAEMNKMFIPDSSNRRRKGSHSGKGLRHFSMKVCEKVQRKQITSYNEVADELVSEISEEAADGEIGLQQQIDQSFDQKNIRRRVYDALNVLMAMNIISKEKKEIKWIGLPTNTDQEYQSLEQQELEITKRIQEKKKQLSELIIQQVAFKNLVERNKILEQQCGPPPINSTIQLPFILVTTSKDTVIECNISSDKTEYSFKFDKVFSIHDDIDVLKAMGMAYNLDKSRCTKADFEKVLKMIPAALHPFAYEMAHFEKMIKTEPESCGSSSYSAVDSLCAAGESILIEPTSESLDEITWGGGVGNMAVDVSSCASRSDQPSPDFSEPSDSG